MDISKSDPLLAQLEDRIHTIEVNQQRILRRLDELENWYQFPTTPHSFSYTAPSNSFQHSFLQSTSTPSCPANPLPQSFLQSTRSPTSFLANPLSQNFLQSTRTPSTPANPLPKNSVHSTPPQFCPANPLTDSNNGGENISVTPTPIEGLNSSTALPSSEIQKNQLRGIDDVLSQYKRLTKDITKAGSLASKLAREAIFGVHVMKLCTPLGNRELPGLPVAELNLLKKIVLQQYPQFWQDVKTFDPYWKKCQCAIEQACKALRRNT